MTKMALFTDIHYGAKDAQKNDAQDEGLRHNQDCDRFIDHFCDEVRKDKEIDCIGFLGDWNQNRTSINLETFKFAYDGAKKINDLGLPVIVILGNHDLYRQNSRTVHSLHFFEQFDNFHLIEDPEVVKNANAKMHDVFFCPFLMHGEEASLHSFKKVPLWFGHFEFNGYEITAYGTMMENGADPDEFPEPELIVSGHFHKRQSKKNKNVVYMGNPFPTSFSDANDDNRGWATYDFRNNEMLFNVWEDAPSYKRIRLSTIIDKGFDDLNDRTYAKVIVDVPISYEESAEIQKEFMKDKNPRAFSLEESIEIAAVITESESSQKWNSDEGATVDEQVVEMLGDIESEYLDTDVLVDVYTGLE